MAGKLTAAQLKLYNLIVGYLDEERKPRFLDWGADVIADLKTADAERLARTVQVAIEDNIKLHGGNIESDQTQSALEMVLAFLFVFDNTTSAYWNKTRKRRALHDELASLFIEEGLKQGVVEKVADYVQMAQNPAINALAAMPRKAIQLDIFSPDGYATVGKGKSKVAFTFKQAAENGLVKEQDFMLLASLLIEFTKTKQQTTLLPLEEYLRLRGRKVTPSNIREIRKEVEESLSRLRNIASSFDVVVNKKRNHYDVRISGGTTGIENGCVRWNWNTDFMDTLKLYAPMDFAVKALQADPRRNVFSLSYALSEHLRLNEGKPNWHTATIKTLLARARNLPLIEEVRRTDSSPKKLIIDKFFKDLDDIENLYYSVFDKDGNEVQPEDITDYETFIGCKITFDFEGHPQHPERAEAREKREAARKKRESAKNKKQDK